MELGPGSGFLKVLIWIWSELHDPDQWIQIHKPSKSAVIVVFFSILIQKSQKAGVSGSLRGDCIAIFCCSVFFTLYTIYDRIFFTFRLFWDRNWSNITLQVFIY